MGHERHRLGWQAGEMRGLANWALRPGGYSSVGLPVIIRVRGSGQECRELLRRTREGLAAVGRGELHLIS